MFSFTWARSYIESVKLGLAIGIMIFELELGFRDGILALIDVVLCVQDQSTRGRSDEV